MQSRLQSLAESCLNVSIGLSVALCTQLIVFPLFNIHIALIENISIAAIFTTVSVVRSFCVRRFFNWLHG
jgi:hypothetical protein